MRVAIPVSDGRVDRVLDCATGFIVLDLRDEGRSHYFATSIGSRSMRDRARELVAMGINVVLCNEVSHSFESLIRRSGIEICTHHSGTVDDVIEAFVVGCFAGDRPYDSRRPAQASVS
jgi:predicted Fe-Mo cluster-binding NifX family protein